MELSKILLYALVAIAGTFVTAARLLASRHVLWRDPGDVSRLDVVNGPGGPDGAPAAPFHFIEEHASGSQPCLSVHDARLPKVTREMGGRSTG